MKNIKNLTGKEIRKINIHELYYTRDIRARVFFCLKRCKVDNLGQFADLFFKERDTYFLKLENVGKKTVKDVHKLAVYFFYERYKKWLMNDGNCSHVNNILFDSNPVNNIWFDSNPKLVGFAARLAAKKLRTELLKQKKKSETNTARKIKRYVPEKRKLYRIKELTHILNMSKTNIYNRIKEGNFPKPQKIGGMSVWKPEVVDEWIEKELLGDGEVSEHG